MPVPSFLAVIVALGIGLVGTVSYTCPTMDPVVFVCAQVREVELKATQNMTRKQHTLIRSFFIFSPECTFKVIVCGEGDAATHACDGTGGRPSKHTVLNSP